MVAAVVGQELVYDVVKDFGSHVSLVFLEDCAVAVTVLDIIFHMSIFDSISAPQLACYILAVFLA